MKSHIVYEQRLVLMQRTKTNIKRIQSSHASIYGIQYGKNYKTPNVIYTPPSPPLFPFSPPARKSQRLEWERRKALPNIIPKVVRDHGLFAASLLSNPTNFEAKEKRKKRLL